MKAQKKRSKQKERYIFYKKQSIAVNSVYSTGTNCPVILFYAIDGNELYFKRVSHAKRYLDSVHGKTRQINDSDDIPF